MPPLCIKHMAKAMRSKSSLALARRVAAQARNWSEIKETPLFQSISRRFGRSLDLETPRLAQDGDMVSLPWT